MISRLLRVRHYPLTLAVGATLVLSPVTVLASTAIDNKLIMSVPWRHVPGTLAVGIAVFVAILSISVGQTNHPPVRLWSFLFFTWATISGLNLLLIVGSGNAITPSAIAGVLLPAAFVRYKPLVLDTRFANFLFPAGFILLSILFFAFDGLGLVRDQAWAASRIAQILPWDTGPFLLARWSTPWADANLAGTLALCAAIVSWNAYRGWMRFVASGAAIGLLVLAQSRYALLVSLGVLSYLLVAPRLPSDKPRVRTVLALCIAGSMAIGVFLLDPSLNGRVIFIWHSLELLREAGPFGVCLINDCVIGTNAHLSHSSILEPVVRFGALLLIPLLVFIALLVALTRQARFKPTWATLVVAILGGYWLLNFQAGISYWNVVSAAFVMSLASVGVRYRPDYAGLPTKTLLYPDGVQQQRKP